MNSGRGGIGAAPLKLASLTPLPELRGTARQGFTPGSAAGVRSLWLQATPCLVIGFSSELSDLGDRVVCRGCFVACLVALLACNPQKGYCARLQREAGPEVPPSEFAIFDIQCFLTCSPQFREDRLRRPCSSDKGGRKRVLHHRFSAGSPEQPTRSPSSLAVQFPLQRSEQGPRRR